MDGLKRRREGGVDRDDDIVYITHQNHQNPFQITWIHQVDFEISALEVFIWSLASKADKKHKALPAYLWMVLCMLVRVPPQNPFFCLKTHTPLLHPCKRPRPPQHLTQTQGPFELVARVRNVLGGVRPLRSENLLPFLQLALLIWGQGSVHVGFRCWGLMHCFCSLLLGLEAFPLHHSDHSWSDGK